MEQSLRTDEEERYRQVRFRSIEELRAKRRCIPYLAKGRSPLSISHVICRLGRPNRASIRTAQPLPALRTNNGA